MASLASLPMVEFSPVVAFRETRPGAGFCAVPRGGARRLAQSRSGPSVASRPSRRSRASRGDAPRRPKGAREARDAPEGRPTSASVRSMAERRAPRASPPRRSPARSTARPTLTRLMRREPLGRRRAGRFERVQRVEPGDDAAPSSSSSTREVATTVAFAALAASAVASAGGPAGALVELQRFGRLLVENHLPGVGGVIEDSFLGLLVACTVYSLWRSSLIPAPVGNPIARKSRRPRRGSTSSPAAALYGAVRRRPRARVQGKPRVGVDVGQQRALSRQRAVVLAAHDIFKASKEGKYAMKLGYSFVASFQGVVFIAWSAQPDAEWMYWAVIPFWYFSVAKLWESTEFVPRRARVRIQGRILDKITAGSSGGLGRMTPDAATLTYVSLNAFAAISKRLHGAVHRARSGAFLAHLAGVQ